MTGMPRRDSTDDSAAPQFVEHERTQLFARRYEDPAVVNVHVVPRARLAMGTDRQAPVPPRREPTPTPSELDASYAAVLRALR
jgi:hypothetical protein